MKGFYKSQTSMDGQSFYLYLIKHCLGDKYDFFLKAPGYGVEFVRSSADYLSYMPQPMEFKKYRLRKRFARRDTSTFYRRNGLMVSFLNKRMIFSKIN